MRQMVAVGADAVQLCRDRCARWWARDAPRFNASPHGWVRIRGWTGGGFELARMPFADIGGGTTTVMAHVSPRTDRVDRFVLFVGGAGD